MEVDSQSDCASVDELRGIICENIDYFDTNHEHNSLNLSLRALKTMIGRFIQIEEIKKSAHEYDFDEKTPGNGYWSILYTFDAAVIETTSVCTNVQLNREKLFFNAGSYTKYNVQL